MTSHSRRVDLGDAREELLDGGTAACIGVAGRLRRALPRCVTPSTASRNVLLGIVPVSTHTPPTMRPFSTIGRPVAELGGLHGGALAGRAASETEEIEVVRHWQHRPPGRRRLSYRNE